MIRARRALLTRIDTSVITADVTGTAKEICRVVAIFPLRETEIIIGIHIVTSTTIIDATSGTGMTETFAATLAV